MLFRSVMRAYLNASSAVCTAESIKHDFRASPLRLRVGAPQARKGTSLHEYGRSYPGTVMDGIMLDVEDCSPASFHRM
jgi:hypothetical protein